MTHVPDTELIPTSPSEPPRVIAPDRATLFADRARRFDALAAGHALGDWLHFLAALSRAQHSCLNSLPALALPGDAALAQARARGVPPVPAQATPRDPVWRAVLRCLCEDLADIAPAALRPTLVTLASLRGVDAEAMADRVLHTELCGPDGAALTLVAAALQVYWTAVAGALGSAGIAPLDTPGACPCCGFLPVASIVREAGGIANLRYLHCALCNTEWNLVRVKCSSCQATADIGYRRLESKDGKAPPLPPEAVLAETCEACKSYLKIVYREKGGADPVADDLATLMLDILADTAGYARSGPNLLLMPG